MLFIIVSRSNFINWLQKLHLRTYLWGNWKHTRTKQIQKKNLFFISAENIVFGITSLWLCGPHSSLNKKKIYKLFNIQDSINSYEWKPPTHPQPLHETLYMKRKKLHCIFFAFINNSMRFLLNEKLYDRLDMDTSRKYCIALVGLCWIAIYNLYASWRRWESAKAIYSVNICRRHVVCV